MAPRIDRGINMPRQAMPVIIIMWAWDLRYGTVRTIMKAD
jgi:hypothetical protein